MPQTTRAQDGGAEKAAQLRARIRERQEDRRCMVCLNYRRPSEMQMQRLLKVHAVHTGLSFPKRVP